MKNIAKLLVSSASIALLLGTAAPAFAAIPFLTVTQEGGAGNVRITVTNADAYSQITMYRRQSTQLWTVINNFGQTDQSGYFSQISSLGADGSNNAVEQYVMVNGQQSSIVQTYPGGNNCYNNCNGGCTYNCSNSGNTTVSMYDDFFSPKSINISAGTTVVWTNYGTMNHTVTADDNSFTSGSLSPGATFSHTFTVSGTYNYHCIFHGASGGVGMSGSVIVSGGGNNNGSVWFSPNNPSMYVGQSLAVSINSSAYNTNNYGNNAYYISSNSNPGGVSATVSGSVLNLYAYQSGSASISVCQGSLGFCGTLSVLVNGGNYGGTLSFSPSSLNMQVGQTTIVYAQNLSNNSLYLSSNSNTSVASVSVSGTSITVTANNAGYTNVTLCANNGYCGTFPVNVSGYNYGNGSISFSQSSVNLNSNQSTNVTIYGSNNYSNSYYISSNSNSSIVSASISGNTIYLYAQGTWGTSNISVCQSGGSNCATLSVTVNGYTNTCTYNCGNVLGTSTYGNGQLISLNGTVYIIYKNTQTAFGNASAFLGLGFNFNQPISAGYSNLVNSGYVVSTAKAAHPWGSWVKDGGNTVYFVHELGLIPVPNYNMFISNGGADNLVVKANAWDFQRPILSEMVVNDSRLR